MSVNIKLFLIVACGIAVTASIVLTADLPNKRPNGFKRSLLFSETLSPEASTEIEAHVRQIISFTKEHIYLSTGMPGEVLVKDHHLNTDATSTSFLHDSVFSAIGNVFKTQLDLPHLYIFASNIPAIIRSSMDMGENRFIPLPGPAFSYAVALSESSYVLRQFKKGGKDKHFVKYNTASRTTHIEDSLSLQSGDGGLSTDGQLHYDRIRNRLLYMHYYNNTILNFDTNLVLINRFHTIDTTSSRFRLGTGAPLANNQKSCIYNEFLLVCSNLKADNETFRKYRNNIPVDVYQITTGTYKGSFYVPLSEGKLVKSMKAHGNKLSVLYHDNRLSIFVLPL